jgi:dolichol-phosphate mannosyltransferase
MGSRYLFIVLYVFLEHHLSRGDYRSSGAQRPRLRPVLASTLNEERPSDHPARP